MRNLFTQLMNDEAGFIVSAELILVATISVLSMIVGLSEVAIGVNQELEDVGSAFGSINQTFRYQGHRGHKGKIYGSRFRDHRDSCDGQCDISCDSPARGESRGHGHH